MQRCKVRDLVDIKKGDYITKNEANEGDYPVILGGKEPAYYIDRYNHVGKAIVISRSGASAGYVSFWDEPIFITDGFIVEPKEEYTHEYIYYVLKSRQTQLHNMQNGSAIPHITPDLINMVDVDLHEKKDREKVVSILKSYDEVIENNNKRIKILEQMAENLYKEWFVRFRFPGHEDVEFEGRIPKGWETGRIGDIVEFLNGFAFKSEDFIEDGKYKIITIKSVKDEGFDDSGADTIDDIPQRMPKHCYLNDGDILISLTGNVGRVCLAYGDNNLLNQRVAKFKTAFPMFAYCLFKTEYMQIMLNNLANGTAQLNLSPVKTARLKILIPEKDIINQFENHVKAIFKELLKLKYENINLQKQRDLLLPRLMSGKLEVK